MAHGSGGEDAPNAPNATHPADPTIAGAPAPQERGPAAKLPPGVSREARRVAGARRNPTVVGAAPDQIPVWLRTLAGWAWRLLIIAAAVALVFWATTQVRLLFVAVFVALVFTAVLRPLVNVLDKVMWRPLAVVISMLAAFGLFGGLLTYVVASVAGQWNNLAKQFNAGLKQILDFLNQGPFHLNIHTSDINGWVDTGRGWLTSHSGDIASTVFSQAGSVAEVFTAFALALFCTIFFLARGAEMWAWFLNQMPAAAREPLKDAGGAGWYTFSGYARGTVIIALVDAVLAGVWLTILNVPLAAPLAVLVFIGAFIPLIGAPLAMVIAMIVALATHGVWSAALVGLGIAGIGQFEGHVLQPLVMGRQVSLHPVVVACSVTAGTLIGGLLGAIIAVPLVAVTWAVYSTLHTPDAPTVGAGVEAVVPDAADEDPAP